MDSGFCLCYVFRVYLTHAICPWFARTLFLKLSLWVSYRLPLSDKPHRCTRTVSRVLTIYVLVPVVITP